MIMEEKKTAKSGLLLRDVQWLSILLQPHCNSAGLNIGRLMRLEIVRGVLCTALASGMKRHSTKNANFFGIPGRGSCASVSEWPRCRLM